jgi:NADH-quinone oxidoreductase subunit J
MLLYASLILLVVFALLVCVFRDLLYAAVSLALASVMLSAVLFQYGANIAAVFELSVCAGLITVLFVSTVSLTKNSDQAAESRLPAYFLPFILVLFLGLDFFLVKWLAGSTLLGAGAPPVPGANFHRVFWGQRMTDVVGQVSLILAGVYGILTIMRAVSARRNHD